MARGPWLRIAGVPQHVIQRGNNRQGTFFVDENCGFYLRSLQKAVRKHEANPATHEGTVYLMAMKHQVADLPLHGGKAPAWLFGRMWRMAGAITMAVVDTHGPAEMLRSRV